MLLLSLGLHSLFLFIPITSEQKESDPAPVEKRVQITQLPPKSRLKTAVKPAARPRPKVTRQKAPASPLVVKKPPAPPKPSLSELQAQQAAKDSSSDNDPFADFPRYPDAQPGSGGVLPENADSAAFHTKDSLTKVIEFYKRALSAQKYQSRQVTNQSEFKVFELVKGGQTQYLHFIVRNGTTAIVLAPSTLDPSQLDQLEVLSPEERAFQEIMKQIDSNELFLSAINLDALAEPDKFSKGSDVELKGILGKAKKPVPDLAAYLTNRLQEGGFEVSESGSYGGGRVYQVAQNDFRIYLSLVPTSDGTGTAILTLKKSPL